MGDAALLSLMRRGTALHQQCDYGGAEKLYREVLALSPHAGASILLANAMLSRATALASGLSVQERLALRAASLPLARAALDKVEEREPAQRVRLLARFAYYLLAFAGLVKVEGCVRGSAAEAALPAAPERAALLAEATEALQRVVGLDPAYTLAWRNLGIALTASARPAEAEAALRSALGSLAAGARAPWELLYKHGKCLKRLGREAEALQRYCDAAEASEGREELPLFWLRVALAEARERAGALPPALLARCTGILARYGNGNGAPGSAPLGAPPNAYIRKLFDGYSAHFDAHLVGVLGYRTPASLRELALGACGRGAAWRACADLGCGTGLAGVAFQDLLAQGGAMDGCDLSPGMVAEAEKRAGLYRVLQAAEVVEWLAGRTAGGVHYDLILCADVLVYIGPLEPLFAGVAQSLRGAAGARAAALEGEASGASAALPLPPPVFVCSTEALLGQEAPGATYELSATGRCRHSAAYIRRLAGENGMVVHAHAREAIRENAGLPVLGDLWVLSMQG